MGRCGPIGPHTRPEKIQEGQKKRVLPRHLGPLALFSESWREKNNKRVGVCVRARAPFSFVRPMPGAPRWRGIFREARGAMTNVFVLLYWF